jgi:hypothetical protein
MFKASALLSLGSLLLPLALSAQGSADPALLAAITRIKAIDNHAHPAPVLDEGVSDDQLDPVSIDQFESFPVPFRLRVNNRQYLTAWRQLYGATYSEMSEANRQEIRRLKRQLMKNKGIAYPSWVLDKLGIEVMLTNRVSLGPGLAGDRFAFVPFVDALTLPLDTTALGRENPDHRAYYVGVARVLKRWLMDLKIELLPDTLQEYLARVVTPILERYQREGSPALKFEAAYMRSLRFGFVSLSQASGIYRKHTQGSAGAAGDAEYGLLQDYVFRYIAGEAGRLGLAVHLHTGFGAGSYFELSGSNPVQLESALNDPALRHTAFVLVHGGWPFTKEVAGLLARPNVYADFSAQAFLLSASDLSEVLRNWLTMFPEKILFGTDTFATSEEIGWEEVGWLTAKTGREALALALTKMMTDGQITRRQALDMAQDVMRGNAVKLYKLPRR